MQMIPCITDANRIYSPSLPHPRHCFTCLDVQKQSLHAFLRIFTKKKKISHMIVLCYFSFFFKNSMIRNCFISSFHTLPLVLFVITRGSLLLLPLHRHVTLQTNQLLVCRDIDDPRNLKHSHFNGGQTSTLGHQAPDISTQVAQIGPGARQITL